MANKDDLLNLNNNKKNIKKPLVYGAIAFLVFIIGVLGVAIYNNSTSKQDNVVIPPQIQEQDQNQDQDTLFKEVPIEEENTTADGTLADKLLKNENEKQQPNVQQTVQKETTAAEKTENKNSVQTDVKAKEETKTKKAAVSVKKETKKTVSNKKYYIQVAALMKYKKPNQKFLNLLKKEGYNYILYNTSYVKNGQKIEVVKILVGPYDKNEAKKALRKIKSNITQNAFIYKVK